MIILNPDYHLKNPGYVLQYYSMSLILSFLSLQFAKPHRYFLLVKANSLAKRTKISEISQSPIFDPLAVEFGDIQISACLVLDYSEQGLEGKTIILGTATISKDEYESQIKKEDAIQLQKDIVQSKGARELVVGVIRVRIMAEKSMQEDNEYFSDIDEFQMKEDDVPTDVNYAEKSKRVKFGVLFGTHFSPNDRFKVQIGYTQSYSSVSLKRSQTTQSAPPSINPLWNYDGSFSLEKLQGGFLAFLIKTSLETVIDKVSIPINKLQPFHQYHLQVVLKQSVAGAQPHIFIQFQLEALPLAFIQEVCELNVNNLYMDPQPHPERKFVVTFSEQEIQQLEFSKVKLDKDRPVEGGALEDISREYGTNYFLSPIIITPTNKVNFEYFFLKSVFVRKRLLCTLFEFDKNSCSLTQLSKLAVNRSCIKELKSCFYNEKPEIFSLEWKEANKKMQCTLQVSPSKVNLYSDQQKRFEPVRKNDAKEQWKDFSNELLLKQKLIQQMRIDIDAKIKNIQAKGKRIQMLRKVERDLMDRKKFLAYKQSREKAIQLPEYQISQKVNIQRLKKQLIDVCEQVLAVENINQQMRLRLSSLNLEPQEMNIAALEARAVSNSKVLQQQQEKIQNIERIDELLKYQAKALLKLEKQFQKGIIDHEMNQLLNKQLKQVEPHKKQLAGSMTMTADEYNLEKILGLLEQNHKKKPQGHIGLLKQQIREAEEELKRKTQIYAKLISN